MFKEYYRNDQATEVAFDADGWFNTGDIVRSDADGWLFFSDREKDMLKVGAENVAASEIESVIMQTGLVEECAVVAQKLICWMSARGVCYSECQGLGPVGGGFNSGYHRPLHGQSGGFQSGARRPYSEFTTTLDP